MKHSLSESLVQYGPLFEGTELVGFSNAPSGEAVALIGPQWSELRCDGADACDFINRMTTVTPHQMADGGHCQGFILEHNGKIKVSFELYRHHSTSVSLFCAPQELDLLTDTLSMFHFAENIDFVKMPTRQVVALSPIWPSALGLPGNSVELSAWRGIPETVLWLCPEEDFISLVHTVFARAFSISAYTHFERMRIGAGLGMPRQEYTDQVTPLDVNALGGIVQQKGCYPGQEVIERTLALGRPAKKLVLIVGDSLQIGSEVLNDSDQKVGTISSIVEFDETSMCGLAIVRGRLDASQSFYTAQGSVSLREI